MVYWAFSKQVTNYSPLFSQCTYGSWKFPGNGTKLEHAIWMCVCVCVSVCVFSICLDEFLWFLCLWFCLARFWQYWFVPSFLCFFQFDIENAWYVCWWPNFAASLGWHTCCFIGVAHVQSIAPTCRHNYGTLWSVGYRGRPWVLRPCRRELLELVSLKTF